MVPLSIKAIRSKGQGMPEPPIYRTSRFFSAYITWFLARTQITPNQVSFIQLSILACASINFAIGTHLATALGSLLIYFSYIIDCCDGELARVTGRTSRIGSQLEQIIHWSTGAFLLIGATFGLARNHSDGQLIWIVGMFALAGETTFHFMYNQLNLYARKGISYGIVQPITKFLYLIMPINNNTLIVAGLLGKIWFGLVFWAILSNLSWIIVFSFYFSIESRLAKKEWYLKARNTNEIHVE